MARESHSNLCPIFGAAQGTYVEDNDPNYTSHPCILTARERSFLLHLNSEECTTESNLVKVMGTHALSNAVASVEKTVNCKFLTCKSALRKMNSLSPQPQPYLIMTIVSSAKSAPTGKEAEAALLSKYHSLVCIFF